MRSGFERTLHAQLKRSKVAFEYETLKLPYVLERNYIPDFVLESGVILEAKGVLDAEARAKMVAVKKAHPNLDIRFVFMNGNNKLQKRGKTTYMDWAQKNGFPAAHQRIPDEWLIKST